MFVRHLTRATSLLLLVVTAAVSADDIERIVVPEPEVSPQEARPTRTPTESSIRQFEARVSRNSRDVHSLIVLGRLYLRHAREADDLAADAQAEETLRRALEAKPDSWAAKIYLASALQARHRFAAARELAAEVITIKPRNTLALATLGDAELHLGRYDAARARYEQLATEIRSPAVLARLAHLAELTGDRDRAVKLILDALADARDADREPHYVAWYELRLGDLYWDQGRLEEAEERFQAALELHADYAPAMSGLAAVHAARGELEQAATLYERAVELHGAPPTMADLGDVYQTLGREEEAERWYDRAEAAMADEAKTAAAAHYREVALFLLDHDRNLQQALDLAAADMELRQDVYAHDALAWAYFKNGSFEEARREIERALEWETQDAMLHFHAGLIYRALGEQERSNHELRKALDLNPHFSLLQAATARRLVNARG